MIFRGVGFYIAYGRGLRRSNLSPLLLSSHEFLLLLIWILPVIPARSYTPMVCIRARSSIEATEFDTTTYGFPLPASLRTGKITMPQQAPRNMSNELLELATWRLRRGPRGCADSTEYGGICRVTSRVSGLVIPCAAARSWSYFDVRAARRRPVIRRTASLDPPRGSVHNFGAAVRPADRGLVWTSDLDVIISNAAESLSSAARVSGATWPRSTPS